MEQKTQQLIAGIFIALIAGGGVYLVTDGDTAYYCEDREIVGICDRLSKVNSNGLQTRCYYNQSTNQYKSCSSGWIKADTQIEGESIIVPDGIDLNILNSKQVILQRLNITEIKGSRCKVISDYLCVVNLKDVGLNKEILIEYQKLNESIKFNETSGLNETIKNYYFLTQAEIINEIQIESMKLLDSIVTTQNARENKQEIYLTNELNISINKD